MLQGSFSVEQTAVPTAAIWELVSAADNDIVIVANDQYKFKVVFVYQSQHR